MTVLEQTQIVKPNVGFIGLGWIGLNRMKILSEQNLISIDRLCDVKEESLNAAVKSVEGAKSAETLAEILQNKPKGLVIATPSALHAEQTISALENGVAVFCQKPLARTVHETKQIVETARHKNVLLGVDFSYRYTEGMQKIYELIQRGSLGKIFAVNLKFHNAYGPDKNWFYDYKLSGGGCVMDLGIHLIDLVVWILNFPTITNISSNLYSQGQKITDYGSVIEDYAHVKMETENGIDIDLSCSWNLQAGQDAIIEATFYGTQGGASFSNVDGSFYDFQAFRFFSKTQKEILASPPDNWSGGACREWARRLANNEGFNQDAYQLIMVASIMDRIYKR